MDERIRTLSRLLVNYSTTIEPGDRCLIDYSGGAPLPLIRQLVRDVYAAGGVPFVSGREDSVTREILLGAEEDQLERMNENQLAFMRQMQAYIAVRAGDNNAELADVPTEQMNLYHQKLSPVLDYRVNKTKWCVLRYPNAAMAQLAGMSVAAFEDFYYDVCTMDYAAMDRAMDALVERMDRTDRVRLTGPGTDLSFSIRGLAAIKCAGNMNIPDGEVFTAPVRESVNGHITYNAPSLEQGFTFENVSFDVENGKIVKAEANDIPRINKLLDTDEGARYFGEFAIGLNPYILSPMKDILFDEKISGSFHLTPGRCYEEADNGNYSSLHWDLVMIQRAEWGGGEMYFDGELVRKDGLFLPADLRPLNPENLK
ncbi:MAG TPA: aminopeptidase [Anaerovoracaceae bacterium]|nr:aminopeptidase [Bacillota bacterium]HRV32738.1 aminopeptidase [Anaerovoracaceae bacterium]